MLRAKMCETLAAASTAGGIAAGSWIGHRYAKLAPEVGSGGPSAADLGALSNALTLNEQTTLVDVVFRVQA